ncbi:unnamed protein product [Trichobilharzia szidati]|nr:unnamed protein product [Trichobilharzia szidati]
MRHTTIENENYDIFGVTCKCDTSYKTFRNLSFSEKVIRSFQAVFAILYQDISGIREYYEHFILNHTIRRLRYVTHMTFFYVTLNFMKKPCATLDFSKSRIFRFCFSVSLCVLYFLSTIRVSNISHCNVLSIILMLSMFCHDLCVIDDENYLINITYLQTIYITVPYFLFLSLNLDVLLTVLVLYVTGHHLLHDTFYSLLKPNNPYHNREIPTLDTIISDSFHLLVIINLWILILIPCLHVHIWGHLRGHLTFLYLTQQMHSFNQINRQLSRQKFIQNNVIPSEFVQHIGQNVNYNQNTNYRDNVNDNEDDNNNNNDDQYDDDILGEDNVEIDLEKYKYKDLNINDNISDIYDTNLNNITYNLPHISSSCILNYHENITIVCVNFYELKELFLGRSTLEQIRIITQIYSSIDDLCEQMKCIKLNTIENHYLAISDYRQPINESVINCINFALSLCRIMKRIGYELKYRLNLRVGIHTGDIVTCLMNKEHFKFDIFSTNLLIAQKLAMTSLINRIHISDVTYEHCKTIFQVAKGDTIKLEYSTSGFIYKTIDTYYIDPKALPYKHEEKIIHQNQREISHRALNLLNELICCLKDEHDDFLTFNQENMLDIQQSYYQSRPTQFGKVNKPSVKYDRKHFLSRLRRHIYHEELETIIKQLDVDKRNKTSKWKESYQYASVMSFSTAYIDPEIEWHYQHRYQFSAPMGQCVLDSEKCAFMIDLIVISVYNCFLISYCNLLLSHWKLNGKINMMTSLTEGISILLFTIIVCVLFVKSKESWRVKSIIDKLFSSVAICDILLLCLSLFPMVYVFLHVLLPWMLGKHDFKTPDNPVHIMNNANNNNNVSSSMSYNSGSTKIPSNHIELPEIYRQLLVSLEPLVCMAHFLPTAINFRLALIGLALNLIYILFCNILFFPPSLFTRIPNSMKYSRNDSSYFYLHTIEILFFIVTTTRLCRESTQIHRLLFYHKREADIQVEATAMSIERTRNLLMDIIPREIIYQIKNNTSLTKSIYLIKPENFNDNSKIEDYWITLENAGVVTICVTNFYSEHIFTVKNFESQKFSNYEEQYFQSIDTLNKLMKMFDQLLDNPLFYDVQKIKSYHHCYMLMSGSKQTDKSLTHLIALLEYCLLVKDSIKQFNTEYFSNRQGFTLSIGYHCGEVIAGMIGLVRPIFDVFGEPVDIAKKIMLQDIVNEVEVTNKVRELLKLKYNFTKNGSIISTIDDEISIYSCAPKLSA